MSNTFLIHGFNAHKEHEAERAYLSAMLPLTITKISPARKRDPDHRISDREANTVANGNTWLSDISGTPHVTFMLPLPGDRNAHVIATKPDDGASETAHIYGIYPAEVKEWHPGWPQNRRRS